MPTTEVQDTTTKILTTVSNFLQRNRKPLLFILVAVVTIVVGLFLYLEFRGAREERARLAAETVQELFEEFSGATDDARRQSLSAQITAEVDGITADYPRFAAAQRALFVRGSMHWELEQWDAASADFEGAATGFSNSYLTPISLFNAAAAAEEGGQVDRARQLLTQLVDTFDSAEIPRALFALGRIAEQQGDPQAATEYYNRLVANHAGSTWTNLARSRIIALSVQN
ncbi:MAG: hypothetical protein EA403_01360 [Spirochaetaceae bacterium]|nr:MAG: hypothetical protein EA403_01360 [Spirochaetaceae bacterium]